ncbi:hypothetical protein KEM54_004623, partial [Ascosphaera aggregata]
MADSAGCQSASSATSSTVSSQITTPSPSDDGAALAVHSDTDTEAIANAPPETASPPTPPTIDTADEEVALWVRSALERRSASRHSAQSPSSSSLLSSSTSTNTLGGESVTGGAASAAATAAAGSTPGNNSGMTVESALAAAKIS